MFEKLPFESIYYIQYILPKTTLDVKDPSTRSIENRFDRHEKKKSKIHIKVPFLNSIHFSLRSAKYLLYFLNSKEIRSVCYIYCNKI